MRFIVIAFLLGGCGAKSVCSESATAYCRAGLRCGYVASAKFDECVSKNTVRYDQLATTQAACNATESFYAKITCCELTKEIEGKDAVCKPE